MNKAIRSRRPSPSMIVAMIALAVALGGTSYAAIKLPQNSVGAKQIRKNAVSSSKVKDRSLLARDFKPGQLPQGASGPAGGALTGAYPNPGIANGSVGPIQRSASPAARISFDGGFPVPNAADTTVDFNRVDFDNSGFVNPDVDGLTVEVPGIYVVSGGVGWLDPSNNGSRRLRIEVNGTQVADEVLPGNMDINQRQNASAIVTLDAGDQITVELFQSSGDQISTQNSSQGSIQLSAAWVSP